MSGNHIFGETTETTTAPFQLLSIDDENMPEDQKTEKNRFCGRILVVSCDGFGKGLTDVHITAFGSAQNPVLEDTPGSRHRRYVRGGKRVSDRMCWNFCESSKNCAKACPVLNLGLGQKEVLLIISPWSEDVNAMYYRMKSKRRYVRFVPFLLPLDTHLHAKPVHDEHNMCMCKFVYSTW